MANENRVLPYTEWQKVAKVDPFGRMHRPEVAMLDHLIHAGKSELAVRERPSLNDAEVIFGKDFLGPEVVEATFNARLEHKDIPELPFTIEDLEQAKELDMFLVLRVPLLTGKPMTLQEMENVTEDPIVQGRDQIWDWYVNEPFYTEQVPRFGWALVGRQVQEETQNTRFMGQIRLVGESLKDTFYADRELPPLYSKALEDFDKHEGTIAWMLQDKIGAPAAMTKMEYLAMSQLTRRYACEVAYDTLLYRHQQLAVSGPSNNYLFSESMDTTLSRAKSGKDFIVVGSNSRDSWTLGFSLISATDSSPEAGSFLSLRTSGGEDL